MGIRFYCPNGHRLNVKDYLAGKRGICPHCEVRFRIPRESEIPKGSPRVKPGSVAAAGATNGKRRPKKSMAVAESFPSNGTRDTMVKSEPARALGRDPIDEAPEAVWYIRPPSGGQYGPAKGEIMRRWMAEGRVSADSLVWREGWTDWQLAGPLFPALAGIPLSSGVAAAPTTAPRQPVSLNLQSATSLQSTTPDRSPLPAVTVNESRAPNRKKSVAAVIGLALLILVLAVVLVIVVVTKS